MNDKEIDELLNRIKKNDFFPHDVEFDKSKDGLYENTTERKNLFYLKDDLGLIKRIFESNEKVIFCLTKKGWDVIEFGGWTKYVKSEKRKKRKEKLKKEVSYWFNIIVPVLSIYVAYLALKNDNRKTEEDILHEVRLQQTKLIKEEIESYIGNHPNLQESDSLLSTKATQSIP